MAWAACACSIQQVVEGSTADGAGSRAEYQAESTDKEAESKAGDWAGRKRRAEVWEQSREQKAELQIRQRTWHLVRVQGLFLAHLPNRLAPSVVVIVTVKSTLFFHTQLLGIFSPQSPLDLKQLLKIFAVFKYVARGK